MSWIPAGAWTTYVKRLSAVNDKAAEEMKRFIMARGYDNTQALVDYANGLTIKYGEASAALSAEMYDAMAELEKASVPPAVPAETASYDTVAKTVQGIARQSNNPDTMANAVGRLVKQAGADTTLQNALRDGAEFAWIPAGDTCAFCITLASRGWQRASKKTIKRGHAEHIHSNCDCTYAIRFDKTTQVQGYDPEKYRAMYDGADGATPQEKINAMRRASYAENREKINVQKRLAYKSRMDRERAAQAAFDAAGNRLTATRGFVDRTAEWLSREPSTPKVDLHPKKVVLNGTEYTINGRSIRLDPSQAEIAAAQTMSSYTGKKATMMPQFTGSMRNISAPDFILGESEKWDLKELKGQSKDSIRNAIKDCKNQAHSFVIEIGNYKRTDEDAIVQAEKVFTAYNTQFVETLVVTKNNEILRVFAKAIE